MQRIAMPLQQPVYLPSLGSRNTLQRARKRNFKTHEEEEMNRRKLFQTSAALGLVSAITSLEGFNLFANAGLPKTKGDPDNNPSAPPSNPLVPPAHGAINVAFPISDGAVIIDFCGPWEVFQDTAVPGSMESAFHLYTVAETLQPITASGGMQIVPRYTFETAPAPK